MGFTSSEFANVVTSGFKGASASVGTSWVQVMAPNQQRGGTTTFTNVGATGSITLVFTNTNPGSGGTTSGQGIVLPPTGTSGASYPLYGGEWKGAVWAICSLAGTNNLAMHEGTR